MWHTLIGLLFLLSGDVTSADVDVRARQCARDLYRDMLIRRGYENDAKLGELLDETVTVERQQRPEGSLLHGDVFLATYTFQRPVVEAWLIASADTCAVLGGDLETIQGVRLDHQGQLGHAVREYNAYVKATGGSAVPSEHLGGYARAVLELLVPSRHFVVVNRVEDVPLQNGADESARQRARDCLQRVLPMDVTAGPTGHTVSFFSWEEVGGILASNRVLVLPNAEVAVTRDIVCEQLGRYRVRGRW